MEKYPDWLNDFIMTSFGEYNNSLNGTDFVDKVRQDKLVENQQGINNVFNNGMDSANLNGKNESTGEDFSVNVKKDKSEKKDKGLQIEFSSGKHKEKYIYSSIEDFCNGKYVNLANQSINKIAEEIAKDSEYIIKFLEASVASNVNEMNVESAIDLTNKITINSSIYENDYKKISSKLTEEDLNIYNEYLKSKNISVRTAKEKISYYIDFIKNFKEYKVAKQEPSKINLFKLKNRIAKTDNLNSVGKELFEEFNKDEILSKVKGE